MWCEWKDKIWANRFVFISRLSAINEPPDTYHWIFPSNLTGCKSDNSRTTKIYILEPTILLHHLTSPEYLSRSDSFSNLNLPRSATSSINFQPPKSIDFSMRLNSCPRSIESSRISYYNHCLWICQGSKYRSLDSITKLDEIQEELRNEIKRAA